MPNLNESHQYFSQEGNFIICEASDEPNSFDVTEMNVIDITTGRIIGQIFEQSGDFAPQIIDHDHFVPMSGEWYETEQAALVVLIDHYKSQTR